ncbi:MAG: isoprenylcysteine carboxylmethyltransferase family protein [Chloroflexi bacterium]|nr:isoprenylcysteine carboxylmethyltransferase family protein [Chloroflexota bacterium]
MAGPALPDVVRRPGRWVGGVLFVVGGLLALAGLGGLGRQLTPFPKPSPGATLVQSGAYGLARHPVYGGMLTALLGWALLHGRWSGLLSTLVVGLFFDRKASREEAFLAAQFPEYPTYRGRVSKLIPWLY